MSGQIVIAALFVLRRLRFCNRREHTSESVKGVTKLDDLVVDPEPVVGVVDATPKLSYIRPTPGSHLAARSRHPATRVDSGPVSPAFPELSLDSLPVVRKANLPSHPGSVEAVTEVVGQVRGALASHSAPSTVSLEETLLPTRSRVASHTSLEAPSDLEGPGSLEAASDARMISLQALDSSTEVFPSPFAPTADSAPSCLPKEGPAGLGGSVEVVSQLQQWLSAMGLDRQVHVSS
jgi:hypothetical protein